MALPAVIVKLVRSGIKSRRVRFGSVLQLPSESTEPKIGSVLGGRYILGRALGKGREAVLYEARNLADEPRILRRLSADYFSGAKAAAALKHQNIQGSEAVFQERSGVYVVYDSRLGEPVSLLLDKYPGRRMTAGQALHVLKAVCSALDYAHANGFSHGHLSTAQILINDGQVQVKDFGIPAEVGERVCLAPEQETGPAAPESDIYSLGACLYEMLTGQPPYKGKPLSADLDALLARAMAEDPLKRFHSAGELLASFARIVPRAL